MQPDDFSLARAAADGDRAAFAALITRHHARIFRIAWRVIGRQAEAEDIAQDVCAGLPSKLRSFRGDAAFTTWLHRITVNAARDHLRREATRNTASAGWGEVETMIRAEVDEARAASDWLQTALNTLNADLRETVALVLGEGQTHAEAAAALDISEGTVSWRMSEVRRALSAIALKEEHAHD